MSDAPKPLSEQECEDIFEAGAGWCDEVSFARLRATVAALRAERDAARNALAIARAALKTVCASPKEEPHPEGDDTIHPSGEYGPCVCNWHVAARALRAMAAVGEPGSRGADAPSAGSARGTEPDPTAAARLAGVKAGVAAAVLAVDTLADHYRAQHDPVSENVADVCSGLLRALDAQSVVAAAVLAVDTLADHYRAQHDPVSENVADECSGLLRALDAQSVADERVP